MTNLLFRWHNWTSLITVIHYISSCNIVPCIPHQRLDLLLVGYNFSSVLTSTKNSNETNVIYICLKIHSATSN